MKIKDGFILQDVAGSTVALPTEGKLNKMITLNSTGKFLWERLESETDRQALIQAIQQTYDVDLQTAEVCVDNFVAELIKYGLLAE